MRVVACLVLVTLVMPAASLTCDFSMCQEHSPGSSDTDCCGYDEQVYCGGGYTLSKVLTTASDVTWINAPSGFPDDWGGWVCSSSPPYNGNTCCSPPNDSSSHEPANDRSSPPTHSLCYDSCDLTAQIGPLTTSLHNGASCVHGTGLVFDGSDDHASLSPGQNFGPSLTFAVWVWYDSDAHAVSPLLDFEHPGPEIVLGDFPRVILHSNNRVTSTSAVPTQQWVCLLYTSPSPRDS